MDVESFRPRNTIARLCSLDGGVPPTTGGRSTDIITDGHARRSHGKVGTSGHCIDVRDGKGDVEALYCTFQC